MGSQHQYEQPVPPSQRNAQIPPAMEAAMHKALSKQRTDRHASVEAFVLALRGSFAQPTVRVPSPPPPKAQPLLAPPSPETASRSKTKEGWLSVGMDHQKAKRYEEALAAFDQAIRFDPNNASHYQSKGQILQQLGWHREAQQAYQQANYLQNR
ncbi:tetratricopeptide repeat protein [Ktedonobacter sp. SOSP1-85]|uniref:tetratricopeptide repeat protein n=1 Tax=Ktedonobacter sp. SOSP1-85 TaxID=2778367 RepID=UPI001915A337|nr:tetratricopeptide repeat protein [Ktedonobacter sp. SOSP1-85]